MDAQYVPVQRGSRMPLNLAFYRPAGRVFLKQVLSLPLSSFSFFYIRGHNIICVSLDNNLTAATYTEWSKKRKKLKVRVGGDEQEKYYSMPMNLSTCSLTTLYQ